MTPFKAYTKRLTQLNKRTYLYKTYSTLTIHCPQKERLSTDGNFMGIERVMFPSVVMGIIDGPHPTNNISN